MSVYIWQQNRSEIFALALRRARTGNCRFWLFSITDSYCSRAIIRMTDKKVQIKESNYEEKTVKKVTTVIAASAAAASTMITPVIAAGQSAADDEDGKQQNQQQSKGKAAASNIKEAKIQLEAARCASCNCMTYFYCAPLQVYTPFRSAQNHCPPDNVRPAGGYIVR